MLGALGLFLALPGGRINVGRLTWVVLAAGGGTLVAVLAQLAAGDRGLAWFALCALVALFGAVRVVSHRRPVYSALYFVLLVVAVVGLLLPLRADFLAFALLIVYAGAILVTYVFVIMLAQQAQPAACDAKSFEPFWGTLAGFALLTAIAAQLFIGAEDAVSPAAAPTIGSAVAVGGRLFTEYVVGLQLAGLLLLAALIGAIAIARRRVLPAAETEGDDEC